MRTNNKRGISLIVLVITIIVMIILAATIILSLNSSGIIKKANTAKTSSDRASLKEYINVLQAEWELMTEAEKISSSYACKEAYVNAKLAKKGYDVTYSADGEIYEVVNEGAKDALSKGIKIGDIVDYKVTEDTKKSKAGDNGWGDQDVSNKTNFVWRYIGISDDGALMIAPDVTSDAPGLEIWSVEGFSKGIAEIERLCRVLYSTDKGTARSMTIEDVNKLLGYTGPKGGYGSSLENRWIVTDEALTIKQIMDIKGEPAFNFTLGDYFEDELEYEANWYSIDKEDVEKMKHPDHIQYVYYGSGNSSYSYWLASPSVQVNFGSKVAYWGCFFVRYDGVTSHGLYLKYPFDSGFEEQDGVSGDENFLRPVVSLYSTVQLTRDSSEVWKLGT